MAARCHRKAMIGSKLLQSRSSEALCKKRRPRARPTSHFAVAHVLLSLPASGLHPLCRPIIDGRRKLSNES